MGRRRRVFAFIMLDVRAHRAWRIHRRPQDQRQGSVTFFFEQG